MLTLNDLINAGWVSGTCWRFLPGYSAPDLRPSVGTRKPPKDLPEGWDHYDSSFFDSDFEKDNGTRPVELLESYKTHPTATPLSATPAAPSMFKVVRASEVLPGQWYMGPWGLRSACDVATDVNRDQSQVDSYIGRIGPIEKEYFDKHHAVVHAQDHTDRGESELNKLLRTKVNGMSGADCLLNYEGAQGNESLVRTQTGFVSTHGAYGLNEAQCVVAMRVWTLMLRERVAHSADKAREADRRQVLCDPVDEMPNMKDAP